MTGWPCVTLCWSLRGPDAPPFFALLQRELGVAAVLGEEEPHMGFCKHGSVCSAGPPSETDSSGEALNSWRLPHIDVREIGGFLGACKGERGGERAEPGVPGPFPKSIHQRLGG